MFKAANAAFFYEYYFFVTGCKSLGDFVVSLTCTEVTGIGNQVSVA